MDEWKAVLDIGNPVFVDAEKTKLTREQRERMEELQTIQKRVDKAITQFLTFGDEEQEDESTGSKRLLAIMQAHVAVCEEQTQVLVELQQWLENTAQDSESLEDDNLENEQLQLEPLNSIKTALRRTDKALSTLATVGRDLLLKARQTKSLSRKKKGAARKSNGIVQKKSRVDLVTGKCAGDLDEEAEEPLLKSISGPDMWTSAHTEVFNAVHFAREFTSGAALQGLKRAEMQLTLMDQIMQKREERKLKLEHDLKTKGLELNELQLSNSRLEKMKTNQEATIENLKHELENLKHQLENLKHQVEDLEHQLETLPVQKDGPRSSVVIVEEHPKQRIDKRGSVSLEYHKKAIDDLHSILRDRETKIKYLTGQLEGSREQIAEQENVIATLEVELEVLKGLESLDHETNPSTQRKSHLMNELEKLRKENMLLKEELSTRKKEIKRMEILMSKIKSERETTLLSLVDNSKPKSSNLKQPQFKPQPKTVDSSHEILNKMKLMFKVEISRLQRYVEKEKQRCEATVRRHQQEHLQTLAKTHKEAVLVLRAINRFKEGITTLLQRESLYDAVHRMKNLTSLPLENTKEGPKSILGEMGSSTVELLVTVEFILSQAMLNQRLALKETTFDKTSMRKELESKIKEVRKTKQITINQMEKLQQFRKQLREQRRDFAYKRWLERKQMQLLSDKHKDLQMRNFLFQKGVVAIQREYNRAMTIADEKTKAAEEARANMERIVEEQRMVIRQLADPKTFNLWMPQTPERSQGRHESRQELDNKTKRKAGENLIIPIGELTDLVNVTTYSNKQDARSPQHTTTTLVDNSEVQDHREEFESQTQLTERYHRDMSPERGILDGLFTVISQGNEETGIVFNTPTDFAEQKRFERRDQGTYKQPPATYQPKWNPGELEESQFKLTGQQLSKEEEAPLTWDPRRSLTSSNLDIQPSVTVPRLLMMDITAPTVPALFLPGAVAGTQRLRRVVTRGEQRQLRLPPIASAYPPLEDRTS